MQYIYDEEHVGYFMAIAGDDNRYLQILLNFLSNALKFTPAHGTIKVEVRLIDT
jgi:signal transduction histidine kinase